MRRMPRSFVRSSAVVALAVLPLLAAPVPAQSEPPLPTDAEVGKYVAIWSALAADPESAAEVCSLTAGDGTDVEEWDAREVGRELEASASFGPLLRRNGIAGARFAEVTLHLFGGMLGLAYADELDAAARERGRPVTNREIVIRDSPAAAVAAKHERALQPVMARAGALCDAEEDDAAVEEDVE